MRARWAAAAACVIPIPYGPQFEKFLHLRKTYDPDNRFLTDYWRQHLGITG